MPTPASAIPPFYCPIPSAIHPKTDEVEQRAIAWIDASGFCATEAERAWVIGTNSAEFYARFAPDADPERLAVAACWVYWGFAIDDARCDEGALSERPAEFAAMAGRVQRALEIPGPYRSDDPYARAVHDLGERFRACATPVQVRRFQYAHRAWLSGVQWQIGDRARGRMPELDDYIVMRLHSAGGEPTFAMLEIAHGAEVPAREMDKPAVTALTEMAILVAALDNDRHSFAKETGREPGQGQEQVRDEPNVLTVLRRQRGIPHDRAVREAVALRDRVLCRFLRLRDRVLPGASHELYRYLTGLGHGIRGNAEWALRVPRYRSPRIPGEGPGAAAPPEHVHWADRALDSRDEPPADIPSIAWWWDALPS